MDNHLTKIRIRMSRSFSEFMQTNGRNEFISDLSFITGVSIFQILNPIFRKGCVIFEGELDGEAVERLIEAYKKRNENKEGEDISNINEFIFKHSVVEITDDFRIRVAVHTKKKTKGKLVFVHGWRGDKKSFGDMPSMLSDLTGCNSIVYEYPTGIWEQSPSIQYVARNLDNWIRNYFDNSRLAIICHSMGVLLLEN